MSDKKQDRPVVEAGVVGIGGGTGLVGLANLLPAEYVSLKAILIYVAPTTAVVFGFAWGMLRAFGASWINKRNLDKAIREACATRDKIHSSPMSSIAHKENAQQNVEKLEALKFEMLAEQVSSVRATLKTDD